jgi:hypothetical protein
VKIKDKYNKVIIGDIKKIKTSVRRLWEGCRAENRAGRGELHPRQLPWQPNK